MLQKIFKREALRDVSRVFAMKASGCFCIVFCYSKDKFQLQRKGQEQSFLPSDGTWPFFFFFFFFPLYNFWEEPTGNNN